MKSTLKDQNISLWDELDLDETETVARLDRLSAGRLQRLRTEDLLLYHGDLALKLAGLQDKDLVTNRLCLQFAANSSAGLDEGMSISMLSSCPTCCSSMPKCLAEVILDRSLYQDEKGYSEFVAEYGGQFHVIRGGPYLRWKEKDPVM